MIFNKKWTALAIEEMMKNPGLIWLAGLVTLFMGSIIVVLNNFWTSGLPLLITILGWLTLLKGAIILIFPNFTSKYYRKMNIGNIFVWAGILILIIGVILIIL